MSRQSLLRTSFIAALILGSVAGSISTSYAATTGHGGSNGQGGGSQSAGSSNPGGGGGTGGGGGGTSEAARLAVVNPDCRNRRCNPPRPVYVPATFADPTRCTNVWRRVMLDDGTVLEDHSMPMRKHCRVIRAFD